MDVLIWIPIWIGAFALGRFASIRQEKNIENIVRKSLTQATKKAPMITHKKYGASTSVFVDGKEYVPRELYDQACHAAFRLDKKA